MKLSYPLYSLLFTLFSLSFSACIQPIAEQESDSIIKIRESAEPASINPFYIRDEVGYYLAGQIFQPLLAMDYQTNELVGVLAASRPKISSSEKWNLIIDYQLRKDIRFSDGSKLGFKDILYSIKAQVSPVLNPYFYSYYQFIDSVSVNTKDSNRFTIYSQERNFLSEFTSGDYYILSEKQFDPKAKLRNYSIRKLKEIGTKEEDSLIGQYASEIEGMSFQEAHTPLGTGAYQLKTWNKGESIQLQKVEDWWGEVYASNTYLIANATALSFYFIEDATIAINALRNGEFDLMRGIPTNAFKELKADTSFLSRFELKTAQKFGFQYLGYNFRNEALKHLALRKAIAFSLPRKQIIEKLYNGYAEELNSFDNESGNTALIDYKFDKDSAKYYMKIFEQEFSKDQVSLTFAYNSGNDQRKAIGLILKEALKEINIDLNVEQYEWASYLQKLRAGEFDLFVNGIVTSSFTPDLSNTLHSNSINGGRNYFAFQDSLTDQLLDSISVEFNQKKRNRLYTELKLRVNKQLPLLILMRPMELLAFSKELENANVYQLRPNYWAAEMSK